MGFLNAAAGGKWIRKITICRGCPFSQTARGFPYASGCHRLFLVVPFSLLASSFVTDRDPSWASRRILQNHTPVPPSESSGFPAAGLSHEILDSCLGRKKEWPGQGHRSLFNDSHLSLADRPMAAWFLPRQASHHPGTIRKDPTPKKRRRQREPTRKDTNQRKVGGRIDPPVTRSSILTRDRTESDCKSKNISHPRPPGFLERWKVQGFHAGLRRRRRGCSVSR